MKLLEKDVSFLDQLASQRSSNDFEKDSILQVLVEGFSKYGIVEVESLYESREKLFGNLTDQLLENIRFTNKEVFARKDGRAYLCHLIRRWGVKTSEDVEDIVQDITRKLLVCDWFGRYNPLISPARQFLETTVRNFVFTFNSVRLRKANDLAFSLDAEYYTADGECRSLSASLFDLDQDFNAEELAQLHEFLFEWENFLRVQPPFRDISTSVFKRLCTLLPPGTVDLPVSEEQTLFFLISGQLNSRVTTKELFDSGISHMVPNELLVDYIVRDMKTGQDLIDTVTGEYVTQKFYVDPNYKASVKKEKVERTLIDLYKYMRDGFQMDEIARFMMAAPTSIPSWVKKLEELFQSFWLITDKIPSDLKELAVRTYKCPRCRRLDRKKRDECRYCHADVSKEVSDVRLDQYPWPRVCGTRDIHDRMVSGKKISYTIKRCAI